tara:strand:+ start:837 stop:1193 length:357 start_codon:yes stop_codon:yes gene_type:complete
MDEQKRRGRPKGGSTETFTTQCIIRDPKMAPFYIKKDASNFEVIEVSMSTRGFKGTKTEPREVEKTIGYYTSFRNALNVVAKHKFYGNEGEFTSIQSYIKSWNEVKNGIESLLNTAEI